MNPNINYTELLKRTEDTIDNLLYEKERLEQENELLINKLADIRNLFDESDIEVEGHGMEDMIADPYAVACYAENKLKRLIRTIKDQQEELTAWRSDGMI